MKNKFGRPVSYFVRTLIFLYLLYLIPVNLILLTHLVPYLASEGEGKSFNLSYLFAFSFFPGRVYVKNFHIDGSDTNAHWQVEVKSLDFKPDYRSLLSRHLYVHSLSGSGVTVTVREHTEEELPKVIERLKPDVEHKPDPNSLPWRITAKEIELKQVEKVLFNTLQFKGNSTVLGAFMLLPGTELMVSGGKWLVEDGELLNKENRVVNHMRGDSSVTIHFTDLTRTAGSQIFNTMDIQNKLDADIYSPDFFAIFIQPYIQKIKGESVGHVQTRVEIQKGVIQPGSTVDADFSKMELKFYEQDIQASGSIHWKVEDRSPLDLGTLTIPLKNVSWTKDKRKLANADSLLVMAKSSSLKLLGLFSDIQVSVQADEIMVSPAERFFSHPSLRSTLSTQKGVAKLSANFFPALKSFHGDFSYLTDHFSVSHDQGKTMLSGKLNTRFRFASEHYDLGEMELQKSEISLKNIRITQRPDPEDGEEEQKSKKPEEKYSSEEWSLSLAAPSTKVSFKDALHISSRFQLGMSNLRVPIRFAVPDSFAVKVGLFIFPMNNFSGSGNLFLGENLFRISNFQAKTSSGKIRGALVSQSGGADASVRFAALFHLGVSKLCFFLAEQSKPDISFGQAEEKCLPVIQKIDNPDLSNKKATR